MSQHCRQRASRHLPLPHGRPRNSPDAIPGGKGARREEMCQDRRVLLLSSIQQLLIEHRRELRGRAFTRISILLAFLRHRSIHGIQDDARIGIQSDEMHHRHRALLSKRLSRPIP